MTLRAFGDGRSRRQPWRKILKFRRRNNWKTKVKTDPIAWGICDFESDLRWWLEKGCLPLKILFSTPSQQDLMEHVSPLKYVPSFTSFVTDDSGEVWVLALFQHHRWPFICFLKGLHDNSTINDFQFKQTLSLFFCHNAYLTPHFGRKCSKPN